MCDDGCIIVGPLLAFSKMLGEEIDPEICEINPDDYLDQFAEDYPCYKAVADGSEYGHINYSVMGFAATHGHLECLRILHCSKMQWHTDLAMVAAIAGHIQCLQFIVEKMGDVSIERKELWRVTEPKCRSYLEQILKGPRQRSIYMEKV